MARPRWSRRLLPGAGDLPAGLELTPGERVLAVARVEGGHAIVATTTRVHLPDDEGVLAAKPWHLVDAGRWQPEGHTLTLSWVGEGAPTHYVVTDEGRLPTALHERVAASVVLLEHVLLDATRRARVAIRKDFGSGEFILQVIPGPGVHGDDPQLREATDDAARRLAEHVGLTP